MFAPVIIPTLNRYEHFRRCLESLERCTLAKKTDVYVALDYPPSDIYIYGWKKNNEYLVEKEKNNGFRSLTVYRRKENYYFSGKGNCRTAVNDLPDYFDRYILSEDDNEFSPCFLEFMNQALDKYKNNPHVYSVCGYNQFYVKDKQIVFVYDNSAWGSGYWKDRPIPTIDYVKNVLRSPRLIFKIWRIYPMLLLELFNMLEKRAYYGDVAKCIMCICDEMYQLRPSISLVRNTGDDGSGLHTGKTGKHSSKQISTELHYKLLHVESVQRTKELDKEIYHNLLPESILGRLIQHLSIIKHIIRFYI